MIIQSAPPGRPHFAITMDEHTALAARFARAFGNAAFEPVEPREIVLYLVEHHDRGWADLDGAPQNDPRTGLPYNLADTPVPQITRTSSASPDFNEKHHPYCGLLSSMHSWGLYNGRYGLSDMVLIDRVPAPERHYAERMLEGEQARQRRIKADLCRDPRWATWIEDGHLLQNYKQLQFFDTLALYFNRTHEGARGPMSFRHVPQRADADATVSIRPLEAGVYALSPFPFAGLSGEFSFSGRYVEPQPAGAQPDWTRLLDAAPRSEQRVTLVAV